MTFLRKISWLTEAEPKSELTSGRNKQLIFASVGTGAFQPNSDQHKPQTIIWKTSVLLSFMKSGA